MSCSGCTAISGDEEASSGVAKRQPVRGRSVVVVVVVGGMEGYGGVEGL